MELTEKTNVIFRVQPQVVNLILKLGHTFNAHSECEPCKLFRVDTTIPKDVGVHHAGTCYFHPATSFANKVTGIRLASKIKVMCDLSASRIKTV